LSEKPATYCDFVTNLDYEDLHRHYHDTAYGYPIIDDNELFGRLVLEINQAGLSWTTILKKQHNFRIAFDNFNVNKVANYTETDRERLLSDAGIIRNKLKVNAAIVNAKRIVEIQSEFGSFKNWLDIQQLEDINSWVKLFKKNFTFVGGEIVNEFLMSTGYIKGAHLPTCPIYKIVSKLNPPFLRK